MLHACYCSCSFFYIMLFFLSFFLSFFSFLFFSFLFFSFLSFPFLFFSFPFSSFLFFSFLFFLFFSLSLSLSFCSSISRLSMFLLVLLNLLVIESLYPHFGGIKQCKCKVILRDFLYITVDGSEIRPGSPPGMSKPCK